MTEEKMALLELIEKSADADLVREMLGFAATRLMEAEVEARTGAAHGVRDPARQVQRNGYRERGWPRWGPVCWGWPPAPSRRRCSGRASCVRSPIAACAASSW